MLQAVDEKLATFTNKTVNSLLFLLTPDATIGERGQVGRSRLNKSVVVNNVAVINEAT